MHNGNGHRFGHGQGPGNGGGKRWLLIALLVLGGFWLLNDAYSDGYRDAIVQTGQAGTARYYRGGPDFPWGLVIVGGIGYVAWRKGAFDRFTGPGGAFGPGAGGYNVQRYGGGGHDVPPAGPGFGPAFRGPRSFFDDWHRQAHEAEQARQSQPPAAQPGAAQAAYAGQPTTASGNGQGKGQGGVNYGEHHHYQAPQAPAPTPPAPEYWTTLGGPVAQTGTAPTTPTAPGETRPGENTGGTPSATTERW